MTFSPLDAVKGARELSELIKKYNDVDLYKRIVELQAQITEQASELLKLNDENRTLREEANKRAATQYMYPYYYENGDAVPLCPKCFVNSEGKKRSHMTDPAQDFSGGYGRKCTVCDEFMREGPKRQQNPIRKQRIVRGGYW